MDSNLKKLMVDTTSRSKYLQPILMAGYFVALVLVAVTAGRICLSSYYLSASFDSGSDTQADEAVTLEADSAAALSNRGMIAIRNKDFKLAADYFERASAIRPADPLLRLRVGYSYAQLSDLDRARASYEQAISLAPNYSQSYKYLGLLLLDAGRPADAFPYLSEAAKREPSLYPEVLHLARIAFPGNASLIEQLVQPRDVDDQKVIVRYLIGHDLVTENQLTFLEGPTLTDTEKEPFIRELLDHDRADAAYRVWATKQTTAGQMPPAGEKVFDGGFESLAASDESGFGWQIAKSTSELSVSLTENQVHSGNRALS